MEQGLRGAPQAPGDVGQVQAERGGGGRQRGQPGRTLREPVSVGNEGTDCTERAIMNDSSNRVISLWFNRL